MARRTRTVVWKPSPTSEGCPGRRRSPALRAWCLAALVALTAVAASRASEAAPAAGNPKAAAKKKLLEGAEALKRGDFQAALDRFQAAYDLVPSPKILYNFGLAYMGLARNAEALQAFHTFLSEASEASSETITNARAYKEALLQKICRLTVMADVDGATIGVDGHPYGTTPRADEILLDAGLHSLLVEKPGAGKSFTEWFEAPPGRSLTIHAKLLAPKPDKPSKTSAPPLTAGGAPARPGAKGGDLAGTVAAPPSPTTPGSGARWQKWTGIAVGGLAVIALGFGTIEWVVKEQKYGKFNDDQSCDKKFPDLGGDNCRALLNDGDRAKTLGYAGFAVGAGLAVVSTVFLILDGRARAVSHSESALACAPSLTTPGGFCSLRF